MVKGLARFGDLPRDALLLSAALRDKIGGEVRVSILGTCALHPDTDAIRIVGFRCRVEGHIIPILIRRDRRGRATCPPPKDTIGGHLTAGLW